MAHLPDLVDGLHALQSVTLGDERIVVAIIDGPVAVDHPALAGARLRTLPGEAFPHADRTDPTAIHGTHVTSIVFGQPDSDVPGVAPGCTGVVVPVFDRLRHRVPQLELARAIERSIDAGAHVINLSGGQYADSGDADDLLDRAVRRCGESGVLLVAAAGNDGCDCLHVPAALHAALAVGALGADGEPLRDSNWGEAYTRNGILAPGDHVLGAIPGGEWMPLSGTSAAAPVVAGVAALLLSAQLIRGDEPDPLLVRRALLSGARPCPHPDPDSCRRLLGGVLDVEGAINFMSHHHVADQPEQSSEADSPAAASGPVDVSEVSPGNLAAVMPDLDAPAATMSSDAGVNDVGDHACGPRRHSAEQSMSDSAGGLVYVLGTLGYDFGSEARRDSFKQLMQPAVFDGQPVPANPHDTRQMVEHLDRYPSEAQALIWTVNLELTPLYAVQAHGPFATDVYTTLRQLLAGEIEQPSSEEFIERVSLPGRLTGQSARLFSGQVVPIVEVEGTRGLYGWRSNWLIETAVDVVQQATGVDLEADTVAAGLEGFLNRVYYDMRNLGVLSRDRALNFAATNAFQAATAFAEALAIGMQLDTIDVEPSPYARADSDAWDIRMKFFDPENTRRARRVFRFTVDVSEIMPVTLGEVRSWSTSS